jgi:6-phosphogluconolactonase
MNLRTGIRIFKDRLALATALSSHVAQAAQASLLANGRFCVALSGGSLMEIIAPVLSTNPLRDRIDWSAWRIFWVDERWVPPSSPDSNFCLARRLLLSRVGVPGEHIHAMDDSKSPDETARACEAIIRRTLHVETGVFPRFDLVLLGLGEDGHVASLFPGHPALQESRRWVVPVFDAPKPPPVRVTMTLPVINHARRVAFVAAGYGKAGIVGRVLQPIDEDSEIPAQRVNPVHGERRWFLDEQACSSLLSRNSEGCDDE